MVLFSNLLCLSQSAIKHYHFSLSIHLLLIWTGHEWAGDRGEWARAVSYCVLLWAFDQLVCLGLLGITVWCELIGYPTSPMHVRQVHPWESASMLKLWWSEACIKFPAFWNEVHSGSIFFWCYKSVLEKRQVKQFSMKVYKNSNLQAIFSVSNSGNFCNCTMLNNMKPDQKVEGIFTT